MTRSLAVLAEDHKDRAERQRLCAFHRHHQWEWRRHQPLLTIVRPHHLIIPLPLLHHPLTATPVRLSLSLSLILRHTATSLQRCIASETKGRRGGRFPQWPLDQSVAAEAPRPSPRRRLSLSQSSVVTRLHLMIHSLLVNDDTALSELTQRRTPYTSWYSDRPTPPTTHHSTSHSPTHILSPPHDSIPRHAPLIHPTPSLAPSPSSPPPPLMSSPYSHLRIPLLTLLSHPKARASLKSFALSEHSEETIAFIEDVEALRELYPAWRYEMDHPSPYPQPSPSHLSTPAPLSPSSSASSLEVPVEDDLPPPVLPSPSSHRHRHTRSVNSISLYSPLQRRSVFSARGTTPDPAPLHLPNLSPNRLPAPSTPSPLPLPAPSPSSSLSSPTPPPPPSASSAVNEAASKIWVKYQPHSQFAISWHPQCLRDVQAEIRRGGGRLESPLMFNGQQEKEIENVQGGTLTRYYGTKEYRRLLDDLITELAVSIYSNASGQSEAAPLSSFSLCRVRPLVTCTAAPAQLDSCDLSSPPSRGSESPLSSSSPQHISRALTQGRLLSSVQEASSLEPAGENSDDDSDGDTPIRRLSTTAPLLPPNKPLKVSSVSVTPLLVSKAGAVGVTRLPKAVLGIESKEASPHSPTSAVVYPASAKDVRPAAVYNRTTPLPALHCSSSLSNLSATEVEFLSQHGFFLFHFNPFGREFFRQNYMTTEYSVDNYDFLLAVDAFSSRAMCERERRKEAKAIYQTYLAPQSKKEVTFPSEMRHDVHRRLNTRDGEGEDVTRGLFDCILEVVLQTVRVDVFRRFIRSPLFHDLNATLMERWLQSQPQSKTSPERVTRPKALSTHYSTEHSTPRTLSRTLGSVAPDPVSCLTFTDVLTDDSLLSSFVAFCKREHSEENVLFYIEATRYSSLLSSRVPIEEIDGIARLIYQRYIATGAPFEVHLPPVMRAAITSELNFLHPDMFCDAVKFVLDVMREDSGTRFLRSDRGKGGRRGTGNAGGAGESSKEGGDTGARAGGRRRLQSNRSGSVAE